MKKTSILLLAGLMAVLISSCGNNGKNVDADSVIHQNSGATESISSVNNESESQTAASSKSGVITSESSVSTTTETAKNVYQGDGFTMKMPDGWKSMNQSGVALLVPNDYPNTADNISIVKADKDSTFSTYTKEVFENTYKSLFENLNITVFEKTTVNNCAAYHMVYNVTVSDVSMKQEQYLIDGANCCLTLTFTSVQNDISALAKECVQSVKFS